MKKSPRNTQEDNKAATPEQGGRLTKLDVIRRMQAGVYMADPAQWVPDALGLTLDEWQKDSLRLLFKGGKNRLAVAACHGSGKCVEANELIPLSNGDVVPATSLIGKTFTVPSVGENFNITHARAYAADNSERIAYRLITDSGRKILRTSEHPLWHIPVRFQSGRAPQWGEPYWKKAEDFSVGDLICVTETLPVEGTEPMDEAQVKLLAYIIADGCITQPKHILFSQADGPRLEEFKSVVEALGCHVAHRNGYNYQIIGEGKNRPNIILNYFRSLGIMGRSSATHCFPAVIWRLPNDQLAIFLSRLFGCDGWVCVQKARSTSAEVGYVTKSERLIRDVHLACLRFGIAGRIRRMRKFWTHKGVRKSNFYWEWTVRDARGVLRFLERIGLFGKEEACDAVKQRVSSPFFTQRNAGAQKGDPWVGAEKRAYKWPYHGLPDGFRWEKIVSVEKVDNVPTVTISVDGTHTFLTTFVEHNSMMSAVITHFFLFNFVPSKVIASGPTGKQTRSQYWAYTNDMWNRSVFKDDIVWFKTKMAIKGADEQWNALWLTSKEPRTIEGFHGPKEGRNLLWVIEEAKGVADPVFEAIQGALSHEDNYLYISSTCGGPRGYFYRCFYDRRSLWHTQRIPYMESTRISPEQVQKWKDQWGENSPIFRARALAEFPDESDNVLVPLSFLERAVVPIDDDYEDNARMIVQT